MFSCDKLTKAREEKGLSITEFMFALDRINLRISPPTIYRWERGEAFPDANELQILSRFFNKPMEYFFN